jgi:hypothetical protein
MSPSIGCTLIRQTAPAHRLECRVEKQTHIPYDWALPGTLENLARVNEFLKEKQQAGYLFGGCLNKRLPRKDIDVFLEYELEDTKNKGYKTLGVDWWVKDYSEGGAVGKNVNGIIARLPCQIRDYEANESGGLLLPKKYLQEHPRSQLVRILYTSSKELKGGKKQK